MTFVTRLAASGLRATPGVLGFASAFFAGDLVLLDHEEVLLPRALPAVASALHAAMLTGAARRRCGSVVLEPQPANADLSDALGYVEELCSGLEYYLPFPGV